MKRPIKFRGRLWDTGGFVFGNFVTDDQEYLLKFDADSFTCPAKIFKIQKNSVAQLVGFDKNGREVYEGDKVISEYGDEIVARLMDNLPPKATIKED